MEIWTDKKLTNEISRIPQENLLKFYLDLQYLVKLAQKDNYENFNIS